MLKDVARYDEALVWLQGKSFEREPCSPLQCPVHFGGYELEPPKRLAEAKEFAKRFGKHPFEYDRILTHIPNGD